MTLRSLLALAIVLAGNLSAQSYNFVVDRQIPDEILAGRGVEPDSEIEADVYDAVRARLIPAKPLSRLERLAEDRRIRERHYDAVRKKRAAIANGEIRKNQAAPHIFSIERLSDGTVLIAWEGSDQCYYYSGTHGTHEAGEDPYWSGMATPYPTFGGVGERSETSSDKLHYYEVILCKMESKPPPQSERVTGNITIRKANGIPVEAIIRIMDGTPASVPMISYELDGGQCGPIEKIEENLYRLPLIKQSFLPGRYAIHATMCDVWDDLGAQMSGGGFFRTPTTYFEIPAELPHHAIGLTSTSDVEPPNAFAFQAELAPHYGPWELSLHDSSGRKLRTWTGKTDPEQGSTLFIPIDERDGDGNIISEKSGPFQLRLSAEYQSRGEPRTEQLARDEIGWPFGQ